MGKETPRIVWIDYVKVLACVFVVMGHFFQSMTRAGILPENAWYLWIEQTIYYFHVPLFFICSGWLYQKRCSVHSLKSWELHTANKAVSLGVPYLTFSTVTWLLKTLFSDSVNIQAEGLISTLLWHPASPFWYLYALFLLFALTPTFRNGKAALLYLLTAAGLKCFVPGTQIQAVHYILQNEIWFVIGMCLCYFGLTEPMPHGNMLGVVSGVVFLVMSVMAFFRHWGSGTAAFLLGVLGCGWILLMEVNLFSNGRHFAPFDFLAQYTMPIFLMHTIFAASFRAVLLKIGVDQTAVHVIGGVAVSFAGPIVAAMLMKKSKWLEFFLYPQKFLKIG